MWKNYIVTAFRNLIRYKGFSIINILGLAIGMAVSILIFLWIQNELSYDKFHEKSDNIYRLVQTQYYSSGPLTTTCMPGPISDEIREDVPEILNSFMFYRLNGLFSYEDQSIDEAFYLADPQTFEMLDFDFFFQYYCYSSGLVVTQIVSRELCVPCTLIGLDICAGSSNLAWYRLVNSEFARVPNSEPKSCGCFAV